MDTIRALLYARVSTPAQHRKANAKADEPSLGQQLGEMADEARDRGWHVVAEIQDVISGGVAVQDRPGGAELYRRVLNREIDLVMVYDNDRIGRDQDALVAKVFRSDMRFQRVQVFSVHQPFAPKAPADYEPYEDDAALWLESVTDTASSVAIRQLRRRLTFGVRNRVEKKKLPVGRPPIGYIVDRHLLPNGRTVFGDWHLDPKYAPVVQRVYDLYEAGYSHFKIAGALNREGIRTPQGNLWTRSTIRGMLTNPSYTGAAVLYKRRSTGARHPQNPHRRRPEVQPFEKWLIVEGAPHAAIVSKAQWHRCHKIAASRRTHGRTFGESSFLSGIVYCDRCQNRMWRSGGIRTGSFSCSRYTQTGHSECGPHYVFRAKLERLVLEHLAMHVQSDEVLDNLALIPAEAAEEAMASDLTSVVDQLRSISERLTKSREAYEAGIDTLPEYARRKQELDDQRKQLEVRKAGAQEAQVRTKQKRAVLPLLRTVLQGLPASFQQKPIPVQKMLIRELVEKVLVDGERVELVLRMDERPASEYARLLKVLRAFSEPTIEPSPPDA